MDEEVITETQKVERFRLRLETRLKNGTLVEAREQLGISAKEAAKRIGIAYQNYLAFESMKIFPKEENQQKICEFYRKQGIYLLEEDIFPNELRRAKAKGKDVSYIEIPREYLIPLNSVNIKQLPYTTINEEFDSPSIDEEIKKSLDRLLPREAEIIKLYFGLDGEEPKTLRSIAEIFSLCPERIRGIKEKAMKRIRRHSKNLKDFV